MLKNIIFAFGLIITAIAANANKTMWACFGTTTFNVYFTFQSEEYDEYGDPYAGEENIQRCREAVRVGANGRERYEVERISELTIKGGKVTNWDD